MRVKKERLPEHSDALESKTDKSPELNVQDASLPASLTGSVSRCWNNSSADREVDGMFGIQSRYGDRWTLGNVEQSHLFAQEDYVVPSRR